MNLISLLLRTTKEMSQQEMSIRLSPTGATSKNRGKAMGSSGTITSQVMAERTEGKISAEIMITKAADKEATTIAMAANSIEVQGTPNLSTSATGSSKVRVTTETKVDATRVVNVLMPRKLIKTQTTASFTAMTLSSF